MAKKSEVMVGAIYIAKISGQLTYVKLTAEYRDWRGDHRGWDGVNLITGRDIHIRGASKLRKRIPDERTAQVEACCRAHRAKR